MLHKELVQELVRHCLAQIEGFHADKVEAGLPPLNSKYRGLVLQPPSITIDVIKEDEVLDYPFDLLRTSAEDLQSEIDVKLSVFDNDSAELLRRVKNVWTNLRDCLERSHNLGTEAEVGRLFHDQVCTAVRELMSLDHDASLHELEQLSQDFEELTQGMHKLLSRKAETQEALRQALTKADHLKEDGSEDAELVMRPEESDEEQDVELMAGKVLSCDNTLKALADQVQDVMNEQIERASVRERNLAKVSGTEEEKCVTRKRDLRQRAGRVIAEGRREVEEKHEIRLAIEEELAEMEDKFSELDVQGLEAISDLDSQMTSLAEGEMSELETELGQLLERMLKVKQMQVQLDLQKVSIQKVLQSNRDLVANSRKKAQQSIKALEQQSNDLKQRVHAFELISDRGAAILDTVQAKLAKHKRNFASDSVRTLHKHHCVDSEIYRHLDSIHRRNMNLREKLHDKAYPLHSNFSNPEP
mmetsp:Transcript_4145/g.6564  ORF Transcript_4145/g.6564 Transcript_4145/m.6564 type:complete len:472 (+) Transcript_4145:271-1686(+)